MKSVSKVPDTKSKEEPDADDLPIEQVDTYKKKGSDFSKGGADKGSSSKVSSGCSVDLQTGKHSCGKD